MKTKILISTILMLLISFGFVAAEFSAQAGYDWLSAQGSSTEGFDGDVYTTSLAIMALDEGGYDTSGYEDWLNSQMATNYCFPGAACTTKDTAMAVIALQEVQDDTNFDYIEEWYESVLQGATFSGDWLLEIATSGSGICTFEYEISNVSYETEVEVSEGTFPSCGSSNFLNLDECIQTNLIKNNPGLLIGIDCGDLEGDVVMTLLYRSATTYYLLNNQDSDVAEFEVNNGCFASGTSGSCHEESSLYANWALNLMGSDINSLIYLKENYDSSSTMDAAIMYLMTKDTNYLDDLIDYQKTDGSFERNVFMTALAVHALNDMSIDYSAEIEDAETWLKEQQTEDGNWNANIEDTAFVLYAAFSDEGVSAASCADNIQNQGEEGVDCGGPCDSCDGTTSECEYDTDCTDLWGDGYECSAGECVYYGVGSCVIDDDCDFGEVCVSGVCMESDCNSDGICDYPAYDENAQNCESDCYCGDGVYDDYEQIYGCSSDEPEVVVEPDCYTDDDCSSGYECVLEECVYVEKSGGFGWIIIIVVILLLLIGGGFFLWKKGYLAPIINKLKGRKKSSPTFRPPYTPGRPPGMPPSAVGMRPPQQQSPMQRSIQQARNPPGTR